MYIIVLYVTVFLSLVSMSCGFNNMVLVFEGGDAGQHCVTPGNVTSDGGDNSSYIHYYPGEQTLLVLSLSAQTPLFARLASLA